MTSRITTTYLTGARSVSVFSESRTFSQTLMAYRVNRPEKEFLRFDASVAESFRQHKTLFVRDEGLGAQYRIDTATQIVEENSVLYQIIK